MFKTSVLFLVQGRVFGLRSIEGLTFDVVIT